MPRFLFPRFVARSVGHFLRSHSDQLPFGSCTIMSVEDWLSQTNYTGGRKQMLQRLADDMRLRHPRLNNRMEVEMARRGLPVLHCGRYVDGVRIPGRDELVKSFIKNEWYTAEAKAPREICARIDPCKIFFGPLIKSFEHRVYDLLDDRGLPYFIKHVPVDMRPRMLNELQSLESTPGTVFRGTDYSTFERVATPEMMYATEAPLYRWLSGTRVTKCIWSLTDAELIALTNTQFVTLLFLDMISSDNIVDCGWFQSRVLGTRMSGEMNTSLGNGWINLMLINSMCERVGCTWHGHVEGDDGIFALTAKVGGSLPEPAHYSTMGAEIKLEQVTRVNLASFCGNVFDPIALKNVGDPSYVISTLGWYLSTSPVQLTDRTRVSLLRAKAMSSLAEYHGTPIIPSLANYILRVTPDVAPRWSLGSTKIDYWSEQTVGPYLSCLSSKIRQWATEPIGSRAIMSAVHGVDEKSQVQIEAYFDSLTSLQELNPPIAFPAPWRRAWDYQASDMNVLELV